MLRYLNWRAVALYLLCFVVLGVGLAYLMGFFDGRGANDEPSVLVGVEEAVAERIDVETSPTAASITYGALRVPATVEDEPVIEVESQPAFDESVSVDDITVDMGGDKNFTGGALPLPGTDQYFVYRSDTILTIDITDAEHFWVNGIQASKIADSFSHALMRRLHHMHKADEPLSYGLVTVEDEHSGAYIITPQGSGDRNYVQMYLRKGDRILYVYGAIDDQTLPVWIAQIGFSGN